MENFIRKDKDLHTLISTAKSHGDFDDDIARVKAALARMLGTEND